MARAKKMHMGVMNIKIHPHSPARYVELLEDVFAAGELVQIRGADWGTPHFLYKLRTEDLAGELYRFLQIDPKKAWLDLRNREVIVDAEGKPIPQVDAYRKPNTRAVAFVFNPEFHRFFYDAKAITPNNLKNLLAGFFKEPKILKKYGDVDVEIESSREVIEKILRIPSLTKLEIIFTRPNGDDVSAQKKRFLERLEKQGIRRIHEVATSPKTEGIKPDEETLAMMELAVSNGKVNAVGYAGEERIEESTVPHPLIVREDYSEEERPLIQAMQEHGDRFIDQYIGRPIPKEIA